MICPECRRGADLITAAKAARSLDYLMDREARRLHRECKGCDCAHNVTAQIEGKAIH